MKDDVYIKSFHTGRFERGVFMDMEVIYSRKCLCSCCIEEHEVKTVRVMEQTRYEGYQVQDKAHDTILKKTRHDPGWFLDLLERAEDSLPGESYHKYFETAAGKVASLYKVKLMKMMWYSDQLSYKRRGSAITGLAYRVMPVGTVPAEHGFIINLKGIPCEEVDMGKHMHTISACGVVMIILHLMMGIRKSWILLSKSSEI